MCTISENEPLAGAAVSGASKKASDEQAAILRASLLENGLFGSIEEAIKAYRTLQSKYQGMVGDYHRQDREFREASRQYANQVELLSQENHRMYMENAALRQRNMEMAMRIDSFEAKRSHGTPCLPVAWPVIRGVRRM